VLPVKASNRGAQAGLTGETQRAGAEVGVSRSSDEARDSTTRAEPRGGTRVQACQKSDGQGMAGKPDINPTNVQKLQKALCWQAKAQAVWRKPKANQ